MHRLSMLFALLALGALVTAGLAHDGVVNSGVRKRMNNMVMAKSAIETLGEMMSGRTRFDMIRARNARRTLLAATRANTRLFRKSHSDPLSGARPEIWSRWPDFKRRAKVAEQVVRALDTRSLNRLRVTLPPVLATCLDCHRTYRLPHR